MLQQTVRFHYYINHFNDFNINIIFKEKLSVPFMYEVMFRNVSESFSTHVPEEQVKVPKHIFSSENEPAQLSVLKSSITSLGWKQNLVSRVLHKSYPLV